MFKNILCQKNLGSKTFCPKKWSPCQGWIFLIIPRYLTAKNLSFWQIQLTNREKLSQLCRFWWGGVYLYIVKYSYIYLLSDSIWIIWMITLILPKLSPQSGYGENGHKYSSWLSDFSKLACPNQQLQHNCERWKSCEHLN